MPHLLPDFQQFRELVLQKSGLFILRYLNLTSMEMASTWKIQYHPPNHSSSWPTGTASLSSLVHLIAAIVVTAIAVAAIVVAAEVVTAEALLQMAMRLLLIRVILVVVAIVLVVQLLGPLPGLVLRLLAVDVVSTLGLCEAIYLTASKAGQKFFGETVGDRLSCCS